MKKYLYYELSVQSPKAQVTLFDDWFSNIHGRKVQHFREDFCGAFSIACEWVKAHPSHTAVGLDIDLEPLLAGEKRHSKRLTASQKTRLWIQQQDVLKKHPIRRDLILAGNFSFNIFKKRSLLVKYFKNCYEALSPKSSLVCECAGGPGMIASLKERRRIQEKGLDFTYIWEQKSFNPITHDAQYAIHFKMQDGKVLKDAFVYDWRLWTLPELIDCLYEAGFEGHTVFWETTHQGEGTGEYVPTHDADNAYAWIAYLMAHRLS